MSEVKKTLILDLDQTLISAESLDNFIPDKTIDSNLKKNGSSKYKLEDLYMIYERPGLQEFLDFLFENFNVMVWTAASKSYACFIVENIVLKDKNRKLDLFLFDKHCSAVKKKFKDETHNMKKISYLWEELGLLSEDDAIILDDNKDVYNTQPENCINCPPFEYTNKECYKDTFLSELTSILKKYSRRDAKNITQKVSKIL